MVPFDFRGSSRMTWNMGQGDSETDATWLVHGEWLVTDWWRCAKSMMNLGVTKQQKPSVAPFQRAPRYCGWKKSCTTLDVWKPINSEINYLSTGMLSLEIYRSHIWSTCWYWKSDAVRWSMKVKNSVAIAVKPTTISGTIVLELRTMILINHIWLLVWNMNFIFHNIWDNPSQLTFIFFRGVGIPPTSIKSYKVYSSGLNFQK